MQAQSLFFQMQYVATFYSFGKWLKTGRKWTILSTKCKHWFCQRWRIHNFGYKCPGKLQFGTQLLLTLNVTLYKFGGIRPSVNGEINLLRFDACSKAWPLKVKTTRYCGTLFNHFPTPQIKNLSIKCKLNLCSFKCNTSRLSILSGSDWKLAASGPYFRQNVNIDFAKDGGFITSATNVQESCNLVHNCSWLST